MKPAKIQYAHEDSQPSQKSPRSSSPKKPHKRRPRGVLATIGETIGSSLNLQPFAKQLQPIIEKSLAECEQSGCRKGTFFTPVRTVFVVLGLVLRRDLGYSAVLNWLICGVRWLTCNLPAKLAAEGTLSHARKRLGVEVFRRIFGHMVVLDSALPADFHGLTSVAFDGTTATMPDTPSNQERFGRPNSGRGQGGFPQARIMALLILPLRLIGAVAYGPYQGKGTGERSLMMPIIDSIPYQNLLFLLDAGLYSFDALQSIHQHHALLAKLSGSVKPKPMAGKRLPDGSYLAIVSKKREDPERSTDKRKCWITEQIIVRVILYQIPGFRAARLITTLLDSSISAKELVIHYHKRWDIELAFDEIKTHQCATLRGQAPTVFRSKTAELVEQELYAMFIVYNLIRDLIHQAAATQNKDPRLISFLESLQCLIDAIPQMNIADPRQLATQFRYLLDLIADSEIDRPQRPRTNPRVIKIKMSKFKRKKPIHKSQYRDLESELHILTLEAA